MRLGTHHIIFRSKKNHVVCKKMNGTRDHHVKQNKLDLERQISPIFFHMQNLEKKIWK
jgi:hypothetical protein